MSPKLFTSMAEKHDLCVDEQIRTWGDGNEFGLAFGDVISLGSRRQVRSVSYQATRTGSLSQSEGTGQGHDV
jgi:hypothetical protein